jgi:hypothetical protein
LKALVLELRWQLHDYLPDGRIKGSPTATKKYIGVVHYGDENVAENIINLLKKEVEATNERNSS